MLPNLTKLASEIGIPDSENVPEFDVLDTSMRSMTTRKMKMDEMFTLFKAGAVFSCVGGRISVTPGAVDSIQGKLNKELFDDIFDLKYGPGEELDAANSKFKSGSWNLGWALSIRETPIPYSTIWFRTLSYVQTTTRRDDISSVFVRITNDEAIHDRLFKNLAKNYDACISLLFQEVYLALFAAQCGFGVDVYAAKVGAVKYETRFIPRVVYFLEAGNSDLNAFCATRRGVTSRDTVGKFYDMISTVSSAGMLLVDLKPGNIVWIQDDNAPEDMTKVQFKCIDFGADYSVILPVEKFPPRCIQFANCCMLSSFVTRAVNAGVRPRMSGNGMCLLRLVYPCAKYVQQYYQDHTFASSASSASSASDLCTALLTALVSVKNESNPFEDSLFDMVYNYEETRGLKALISDYIYVFHAYVSDKMGKNPETIFKTNESIDQSRPFLEQIILVVKRRFDEQEATGLFDDLQEYNHSTNTTLPGKSDPPGPSLSSPDEEDALTPLAYWMKTRGGELTSEAEDADMPTPLDQQNKEILYEEAMQEVEKRRREDPRGYEEEQRSKRADLKRTPIRNLDPDKEIEVQLLEEFERGF